MPKLKSKKRIQVFLIGDSTCEISGELDALERCPYGLCIDWNDMGTKYRHLIPYQQIRMVRLYD